MHLIIISICYNYRKKTIELSSSKYILYKMCEQIPFAKYHVSENCKTKERLLCSKLHSKIK